MKKKAVITVKSIADEDNENKVEVVSIGTFEKADDQYIVKYEETELSGMEGTTTTIIIKDNAFSLNREGSTKTQMDFECNKESAVLYNTPYGVINMKVFTKEISIDINDNGGELNTIYTFVLEDEQKVVTNLSIKIKTDNK